METMGRTGHADIRMLSHYSHPKLGNIHEDQFEFMHDDDEEISVWGSHLFFCWTQISRLCSVDNILFMCYDYHLILTE